MTTEEKLNRLKEIFWDYDIEKLPVDKIINMEFKHDDDYSYNLIINRMLERLDWYDLLDILGSDRIKEVLTKERISKLRFSELRDKYEFLRKILSGENVSFTGWGDGYYNQIKHTLFSNRWYSIKQTLL